MMNDNMNNQPLRGGDTVQVSDGRQGIIVKIQRSSKVDSLEYNVKFPDNTYGWHLGKSLLLIPQIEEEK